MYVPSPYVLKIESALNVYNIVLRTVGSHAVVGTKHNFCHLLLLPGMYMKTAHVCVIWEQAYQHAAWTSLCTPTSIILISLISLYNYAVLYAFYHSGVIHPTAFYIQVLLVYASMVTSQDGLSSAWHTPSESTLGAKTLSGTDRFLAVTVTHKSPLTNVWDSGEMEDMSMEKH